MFALHGCSLPIGRKISYTIRYMLRLVALTIGLLGTASAHDIPSDVTVHAFVKPSGQRLQLLMRVPLKAMRDVDFPENAQGYLDVAKLAPLLPVAATLWSSDSVAFYEEARRLTTPP